MVKSAEALREPLLRELFARLPPAGSVWPVQEQVAWLRAVAAVAVLIYGPVSPPVEVGVDPATGDIAIAGRNIWTGERVPRTE